MPTKEVEVVGIHAREEVFTPRTIFLRAVKEAPLVLALVVLERTEIGVDVSSIVQPLVREFQDVWKDSFPSRLPPLRGI